MNSLIPPLRPLPITPLRSARVGIYSTGESAGTLSNGNWPGDPYAPVACIEDRDIIDKILVHLREKEREATLFSFLDN